jgi:hypothetical protein
VVLGAVVISGWNGFVPPLRWSLLGLAELSALLGAIKLVLTARAVDGRPLRTRAGSTA